MAIELKDVATAVALVLSIYSVVVATRTKKDTFLLSYEQKRQELLLLVAQRKIELQGVVRRMDDLLRDCRRHLGNEHALTSAVGLMAHKVHSASISKDGDAVKVQVRNEFFVSHRDLVQLEVSIGQAKQDLHQAKETAREAEEFLEKSQRNFSAIAPPDA